MTCKGCDCDLTSVGSFFIRNKGPYCRHCYEEIEAMQDPRNRKASGSWLGSWLRRFLLG